MIYFVQGTQTGNIKIGHTGKGRFVTRMSEMQSSDVLQCIGTMPGDRNEEKALHDRFAASHAHREWFKPDIELLAFIESLPASEFTGLRQGKEGRRRQSNKAVKHAPSPVLTRAVRAQIEARYFDMGKAAFHEGKDIGESIGEGKKGSDFWRGTRNMWEWGFETARLGSRRPDVNLTDED